MKAYKELKDGYGEILSVNLQKNKKLALLVNVLAFVIAIVMAVAMSFYISIKTLFSTENGMGEFALRFGVLLVCLVAYLFLHELTHAAVMKLCGTKKVKFGFTGLYAYAGSQDYYDKTAYILIALAPVVLWGVVIAVINAFVPANWFWVVFVMQIINISGATGDLYVTFKFCRLPKDILVKDVGVGMTVYSKIKTAPPSELEQKDE